MAADLATVEFMVDVGRVIRMTFRVDMYSVLAQCVRATMAVYR